MPIFSKSDFSSANNSISVLENDVQDALSLSSTISNFIQSSSNLKGPSWDLVRNNLNEYIVVLKTRENNAENLANSIKEINNLMLASLGEYDSVNTDSLNDLENQYNQLEMQINTFKYSIHDNEEKKEGTEENEKQDVSVDISSLISEKEKIHKLIMQIEEVNKAQNTAMASLQELVNSNDNYNNQTEGIVTSPIIRSEYI